MTGKGAKNIELLAPAKDMDHGIAAINCGADAVYIGAPKFGARAAAGNPVNDIEKLCKFSHKYKVRVYAAMNTILYDNELEEAETLIRLLFEAGVDGIIIQDMGILEMNLPPVPLIASTQVHNTSWQKIKFLEDVGFQRVILARELTIDQIREIREKTNIGLEAFIHGSLCVSYSGQCYLSRALGGRSGNRGECAQPCRMKYNLADDENNILIKDKHLLSLKDLNLSAHLQEMIGSGITSFKIEGRLKDIVYVKNTVAFYRNEIDRLLSGTGMKKTSSGRGETHFIPDLDKTFNRGYTSYFIHGRGEGITAFDSPKSTGEYLGEVTSLKKNSFNINSEKEINNGDGICFYDSKNKELHGTNVNRAEGCLVFPGSMAYLEMGTKIYRNYDIAFEASVRNDNPTRKIAVTVSFQANENGFILNATDEDNITAQIGFGYKAAASDNPGKAIKNIQSCLMKSGGTIFSVTEVTFITGEVFFIPISFLNAARRKLLETLEKNRERGYTRESSALVLNTVPFPDKDITYPGNIANRKAGRFYERHGAKVLEMAYELSGAGNIAVMRMKHCIKFSIGECPKYHGKKTSITGKQLYLKDDRKSLKIEFDCNSCVVKIIY